MKNITEKNMPHHDQFIDEFYQTFKHYLEKEGNIYQGTFRGHHYLDSEIRQRELQIDFCLSIDWSIEIYPVNTDANIHNKILDDIIQSYIKNQVHHKVDYFRSANFSLSIHSIH